MASRSPGFQAAGVRAQMPLIEHERTLRHEAHAVLAELSLLERLATRGAVHLSGALPLRLMVWRDVDILVITPELDHVAECAAVRPLIARDDIDLWLAEQRMDPSDDTTRRNVMRMTYRALGQEPWNIDVTFWIASGWRPQGRRDVEQTQRDMREWLTPEIRAAVLRIKSAWYTDPGYGCRFSSKEIYDAVGQHGARSPADFGRYLRSRGAT